MIRGLTAKELEALEGICADKSQYLISIETGLTAGTITRRLQSAKRKLGVTTLPGLVSKYERLKKAKE